MIKVLVVDDSAVVRQVLGGLIDHAPGMKLLHAVSDPLMAMERTKTQWPDVIVLDVEMPRMDGITFLRKLMAERPTPVVICSTLTEAGAQTTMEALAAGAVTIVTKPKLDLKNFLQSSASELLAAVRAAAVANVARLAVRAAAPAAPPREKHSADVILPAAGDARAMSRTTEQVVAIGTSTGGTQALEAVLTALPRVSPGIVIVQHMPEKFTAAFAARLNQLCLAERGGVEHLIAMSARDPRLLETVENLGVGAGRMRLLGTLAKPITAEALRRMLDTAAQTPGRGGAVPGATAGLDEIEAGLAAQQFVPFVQPKVAMATGLVKGVEALARWRHPTRGLLSPAAFIAQIEGTPLMARLTLAMVEQSLGWLREWQRAMPQLNLSINLSADDLADQAFVGRLMELVQQQGVTPQRLVWEVTETMIMNGQALANLARLGLKGYGLSMDDYGIGYSSMQTLSRSPFTELKIVRLFVSEAAARPARRAMLTSAIEMAHRLGIASVAEGVETAADWALLSELGCDAAQGYLLARPMPAEELVPWARANWARLRGLVVRR